MTRHCSENKKIARSESREDDSFSQYSGLGRLSRNLENSPVQIVRDTHRIWNETAPRWGDKVQFRMHPEIGRATRYIIELRHSIIPFTKIIEQIAIRVNGNVIQSFHGSSLVIYNMIHHRRYFDQNLLIIPFIPFGNIFLTGGRVNSQKYIEILVTFAELSRESHFQYEKRLKKYIETYLIPDLTDTILDYIGRLHEKLEYIYADVRVCTERAYPDRPFPHIVPPPGSLQYSHFTKCHKIVRSVKYIHNFYKTFDIYCYNPISQICVAFWERGKFPNFEGKLKGWNVHIKSRIKIETDHTKALILDKMSKNMHFDEKNPIYTITFTDPKRVSRSKAYFVEEETNRHSNRCIERHRQNRIIRQLPEGVLFCGIHTSIWMSINANLNPLKEMMVGIWIFEVGRVDYPDHTSSPIVYEFKKNI